MKGKSFRERFVSFWEILCDRLQNSDDQFVSSKENITALNVITEQLVSLSSMAVVNVRDAVTEAALTIGLKVLYLLYL